VVTNRVEGLPLVVDLTDVVKAVFRGHEPDGFEPVVHSDNDESRPGSHGQFVPETADRAAQVRDELDQVLLRFAAEVADVNVDAAKVVDGAEHGGRL
jgi:hypothetical protein